MRKFKTLLTILLIVLLSINFFGCSKKVEAINFIEPTESIRVADTYNLEYNFVPEDVKKPKLVWSSSDESIAVVDETGQIKAVGVGDVIITATAGKVSSSCNITVLKEIVNKTDYITVEGIYIDESWKDKDNENNNLVYIYYTVNANDTNLFLSSIMSIKINDKNTYISKIIKGAAKYSGRYYDSYCKNLVVGESLKMVSTFVIPKGDLVNGKNIAFTDSSIPQLENINLSTEEIVACKNQEELAEKADSESYKKALKDREKVDKKTEEKIKKMLNGYTYSFLLQKGNSSPTMYDLTFAKPNKFNMRLSYGVVGGDFFNKGTYEITNKYIVLTYTNTKKTIELPYDIKDGKVDIDTHPLG